MGWVANIFLILGLFLIGYKWRPAFLLTALGEALWVFVSWNEQRGNDMLFLCVLFCILALRNWWLWKPESDFKIIGHYHVIPRTWWQKLFKISPFGKIKITGSYLSKPFYRPDLDETHPWVQEPDAEYKARQAMIYQPVTGFPQPPGFDHTPKDNGWPVRHTNERNRLPQGYVRQGWEVQSTVPDGDGFDTTWTKVPKSNGGS